ncbi:MAG: right-handed parallel beta-helix repeat-containing protein, partial [Pseudomonadota bacterium]
RVTWTPSVNTDGDIITQVLDLSTDGGSSYGAEILVGRDVSSYRFDGLTNGTSYTVRLRQRDAAVPANTSAGVVVGPLVPETTSVTELSGTLPLGVTSFSNEVIRVTGSVTVPSGATLSLGPGTVMKFNVNTSLDVFGHLDARGTALEPVVFTSYRDDSIGGDTNGDGASVGQPGDWYYVYIRQATPGATAFMEHAHVRYAGGAGSGGLLAFRFSEVELRNLLVEDVSTTGILLRDNASAVLDNSLVRNNATNGVYVQRSSGGGGTFTITNNEIRDNGTTGLYVQNYGVTITGNQFIDNTNYGVFYTGLSSGVAEELRGNTISGSNVPARLVLPAVPGEGAGNTISGNTRDHLEVIGTSLTQNRTLDMSGFSAYWLVSGNVAVQPGASLQLREGVIWKLASGIQFQIDGVFSSEGSSANPVIFTSYRDDSVGGDTNGDGLTSGQPGDWYWLYVTANSPSLLSSMAHTEVRFGGSSSLGALLPYNDMLLDHVTVRDSSTVGIYSNAASPLISNCVVEDNATDGMQLRGNGAPEVRDCRIANNGESGIQVVSSNTAPLIADNEILGNGVFGIQFDDARSPAPPITGNTLRGNLRPARLPWASLPAESDGNIWGPNLRNAIWVWGSSSNDRLTDLTFDVRKSADGVPADEAYEVRTYVLNGIFEMAAGTTLTIDPGVVLKLETPNTYLWPQTLSAVGTASDPVVLTSFKDDVYGGDTNGDGAASQAAPGDWTYLYIQSVDGSNIENALLRYGGSSTGMLWTSGADMTLTNVELAFSATSGFYSNGASHVLTNVETYGHRRHGLEIVGSGTQTVSGGRSYANLLDGIRIGNSSGGSYNGMELFANAGAAINHTSSQSIDATGNWWGAPDGPGGNGPGSGDAIIGTGNIDTTSFLTTGTASSYANTGSSPLEVEGTLAAPSVLTGTVTTEFGTSASQSALFDLNGVELSYPTLDPAARYDVFVTYVNTDNTSGAGGNRQRLLADGEVVHDSLLLPTSPGVFGYTLPPAAYADGATSLLFEKLSGYRAVVSQVVLLETVAAGDTEAPVTTITSPLDGARLSGGTVELTGTVVDPQDSAISMVEFGYRQGAGDIVWQAVADYTT